MMHVHLESTVGRQAWDLISRSRLGTVRSLDAEEEEEEEEEEAEAEVEEEEVTFEEKTIAFTTR